MKVKLGVLVGFLLLLLVAVPALAAPNLTVEIGAWYGWLYGNGDSVGSVYDDSTATTSELALDYNGTHAPYLKLAVGLSERVSLTLSGFYYKDEGQATLHMDDDEQQLSIWGMNVTGGGLIPVDLEASGQFEMADAKLGLDWDIVDGKNGTVSLLVGAKGMLLRGSTVTNVTGSLLGAIPLIGGTCSTSYEGYLIGPYVGVGLDLKLGDHFTLFGDVTGSYLWNWFTANGAFEGELLSFPVTSSGFGGGSSSRIPAVEANLGIRVNFTDNLFLTVAGTGSVLFGVPTMPTYDADDGWAWGSTTLYSYGVKATVGFSF